MLGLLYRKFILKYPLTVLLFTLTAILLFGTNITKLEIDASAQTLLLDDDKDLKFLRTIEKRFKSSEMLIMAYKPKYDLLSPQSLETLGSLSEALETLPGVVSVDTLLSVPLLYSPAKDMSELLNKTRTLRNTDINLTLAKREFLTSPLFPRENKWASDFTKLRAAH